MSAIPTHRPTKADTRGSRGLAATIGVLAVAFACAGDRPSPTSVALAPAAEPAAAPAGTGGETVSTSGGGASDVPASLGSSSAGGEEFNCTDLEERAVRFSDPGFLDHDRVGLYYKYVGVPTGRTLLQLFWDEENQPETTQLVDLGDGEIQRNDDSRTDYEGIVEHVYTGVSGEMTRQVRANLISYGRSGNCATVRRVSLTPPIATTSSSTGPVACSYAGDFSANNTQMGRIFRDAIPSGCGGKAYPGIFNPGTPYYYDTYTYQAQGTGTVCVKVNFDPTGGATPCGTNAHASAYLGSYNPASQSTNFLGDVGSSIKDSFQFPVAAGAAFLVVVTNTSSQQVCNYSFTIENATCP
jgi:hypothetical protein